MVVSLATHKSSESSVATSSLVRKWVYMGSHQFLMHTIYIPWLFLLVVVVVSIDRALVHLVSSTASYRHY